MKVSGSATLSASRDEVWKALNDPAVLVRTIPGCQRLESIGDDAYKMTITAGVASIKGVYQGEVRLSDQQAPDTFVLEAAGAGAPGTVGADVHVSLTEPAAGSTKVTYDADAIVGGMIGGVGQRMLSGVAKKTAGEFFAAVDDLLNGRAPASASDGTTEAPPGAAANNTTGGAPGPEPDRPRVFEAPGAAAALTGTGSSSFVSGAVVGAGAALVGVLVGGWVTGRRRS